MSDVVVIEYRDDWDVLSPFQIHAAVPEWPRWVHWPDFGNWVWPDCYLTQFHGRTYLCESSSLERLEAPPYLLKLHALTRNPSGWHFGDLEGIVSETTDSIDIRLHRQFRMFRELPALLADVDPTVLHREDWNWEGYEWLIGAHWRWKDYYQRVKNLDHAHCVICNAGFSVIYDGDHRTGYTKADQPKYDDDYHWICKRCFDDMKDLFNWVVVE
jgi:hypothetical protein